MTVFSRQSSNEVRQENNVCTISGGVLRVETALGHFLGTRLCEKAMDVLTACAITKCKIEIWISRQLFGGILLIEAKQVRSLGHEKFLVTECFEESFCKKVELLLTFIFS